MHKPQVTHVSALCHPSFCHPYFSLSVENGSPDSVEKARDVEEEQEEKKSSEVHLSVEATDSRFQHLD